MNDGPVCRAIHARVGTPDGFLLLAGSQPPTVLRAIIGGASILATSRFHAMVSAMVTGTPVVVAGWSHKYAEVMSAFGLAEFVIPFQMLSSSRVIDLVDCARIRSKEIRASMQRSLPLQVESARRNFQAIRDVLAIPRP